MSTKPNAVSEAKSTRSYTNWDAMAKAKLIPTEIRCQAYPPTFFSDFSCHSRLKFAAETLKRHLDSEHGGGFYLWLKKTDGKDAPLWEDLATSGLEASDFKCAVCHANVRFHPTSILAHLKPHAGVTKQAYRQAVAEKDGSIGKFALSLTTSPVEVVEDDAEFSS